MDELWDRFRIYRKLGEQHRKRDDAELNRWADDGGMQCRTVTICQCGATEADPYCYCGC